jgi:DNA-binding transcriptional ArsR family regulator
MPFAREAARRLGELCAHLDMTRQAVTQHLTRLEDANLIATMRRGREKLHYLNPVPTRFVHVTNSHEAPPRSRSAPA